MLFGHIEKESFVGLLCQKAEATMDILNKTVAWYQVHGWILGDTMDWATVNVR